MDGKKIIAVLPAYNASKTLVLFLNGLPMEFFDEVILIDDASEDGTYELAKKIKGIRVYRNFKNLGYGGNMKRCLSVALERSADVIVEIHPDGEYGVDGIRPALEEIAKGAELVLGNRFKSFDEAKKAGMFFWKYPVNKILTRFDNLVLGTKILDMHQGFRVYSRSLLEKLNFKANSNDFLFTFQIICQAVYKNKCIANVSVSAFYKGKKRGISFKLGTKYLLETFLVSGQFLLAKIGIRSNLFN